jgi:hypothetical protein
MTETVAGWYPDPAGAPSSRWWDGRQWTEATRPMADGYGPVLTPEQTFWQANRYTCLAVGFGALYALLAVFAHFGILGIVPVVFAMRAYQGKERYAVAAAVAAAVAILFILFQLA